VYIGRLEALGSLLTNSETGVKRRLSGAPLPTVKRVEKEAPGSLRKPGNNLE